MPTATLDRIEISANALFLQGLYAKMIDSSRQYHVVLSEQETERIKELRRKAK